MQTSWKRSLILVVYFLSADLKSTYDRMYYLVKYMNSNTMYQRNLLSTRHCCPTHNGAKYGEHLSDHSRPETYSGGGETFVNQKQWKHVQGSLLSCE